MKITIEVARRRVTEAEDRAIRAQARLVTAIEPEQTARHKGKTPTCAMTKAVADAQTSLRRAEQGRVTAQSDLIQLELAQWDKQRK